MTYRKFVWLALPLALAGLPAPALGFACYVGGAEDRVVTVHRTPDARSPIVARLTWSMMVSEGRRMREVDGWLFVRWSREQMSQADFFRGRGDGKGWIRRGDIQGECED